VIVSVWTTLPWSCLISVIAGSRMTMSDSKLKMFHSSVKSAPCCLKRLTAAIAAQKQTGSRPVAKSV